MKLLVPYTERHYRSENISLQVLVLLSIILGVQPRSVIPPPSSTNDFNDFVILENPDIFGEPEYFDEVVVVEAGDSDDPDYFPGAVITG